LRESVEVVFVRKRKNLLGIYARSICFGYKLNKKVNGENWFVLYSVSF